MQPFSNLNLGSNEGTCKLGLVHITPIRLHFWDKKKLINMNCGISTSIIIQNAMRYLHPTHQQIILN